MGGFEGSNFGRVVPEGFKMTKDQHQQVLNCAFLSLKLDCIRPMLGVECPYWSLCSDENRPPVKLVDLKNIDCPEDSIKKFNKLMEEKGKVSPLYGVSE